MAQLPVSSPRGLSTDLSRPRLRELTTWIRDHLDPIIAREGPDVMHPDDVLTLHELFQGLQHSHDITAQTLRATSIHRAVQEVAGKATRWPGRLADECDKCIVIWKVKFGPLDTLRPFLYGRGGRLEGIAGPEDVSRAALLKRWEKTCPDRIDPYRSRKHGGLGFQPGAWWLSGLFAYHAGIIDLEAVEGGICYDAKGSYALLLKGFEEADAPSPAEFTYRCHKNDKGRFRLTAADAKSRYPLRVLRSHNLNSLWAPRAGVRYEGLYGVQGWVVRTIKETDHIGGYKPGELLFEIKFKRVDATPIKQVLKHPVAAEIDDYTEYKRLRRAKRERLAPAKGDELTNVIDTQSLGRSALTTPGTAPPIHLVARNIFTSAAASSRAVNIGSSAMPGRTTTFIESSSIAPMRTYTSTALATPIKAPHSGLVVPISERSSPAPSTKSTLRLSGPSTGVSRSSTLHARSDSPPKLSASTTHTDVAANGDRTPKHELGDIVEVAPWIKYDSEIDLEDKFPHPKIHCEGVMQSSPHRSTESTRQAPLTQQSFPPGTTGGPNPRSTTQTRMRRDSGEAEACTGRLTRKKSAKPFAWTRNPFAKLFDGAYSDWDGASDQDDASASDYFTHRIQRASYMTPERPASIPGRRQRASSSDATTRPLTPIPVQAMSSWSSTLSPCHAHRRDATAIPFNLKSFADGGQLDSHAAPSPELMGCRLVSSPGILTQRRSSHIEDLFVGIRGVKEKRLPLPYSLRSFIRESNPSRASPVTTLSSISMSSSVSVESNGQATMAEEMLMNVVRTGGDNSKDTVVFRNPFGQPGEETNTEAEVPRLLLTLRRNSSGFEKIALDVVL